MNRNNWYLLAVVSMLSAYSLYFLRLYRDAFPDMLLYNVPDFLWAFSLSTVICILWGFRKEASLWCMALLLLACSCEGGQYIGFIPGTFDALDLLSYVAGVLFALFLCVIPKTKYSV